MCLLFIRFVVSYFEFFYEKAWLYAEKMQKNIRSPAGAHMNFGGRKIAHRPMRICHSAGGRMAYWKKELPKFVL